MLNLVTITGSSFAIEYHQINKENHMTKTRRPRTSILAAIKSEEHLITGLTAMMEVAQRYELIEEVERLHREIDEYQLDIHSMRADLAERKLEDGTDR